MPYKDPHQTLLWIARHGHTTDSDSNFFRGQRDSKLDKRGFKGAHEQKEFFKTHPWKWIFCSDMTRGCQTAEIIAGPRDNEIIGNLKILRPWHIGKLTGKDKKKYGPVMQYFIDHPDETIPGGESRNDFEKERAFPSYIELMEVGMEEGIAPIRVDHSSQIHAFSHLLYGPDHKGIAVKPAGIIEVYLEDGEIKERVVLKPGHDDSSYAPGTKVPHEHRVATS